MPPEHNDTSSFADHEAISEPTAPVAEGSDLAPAQSLAARERLLQEALRLFLSHGYGAISTRQICAAAGVTQPTLYHHFGNKEQLYLAVVRRWFDRARETLHREIARDASFHSRLFHVAVVFWSGKMGDYQAMRHDAIRHLSRESALSLSATIYRSVIEPVLGVMRDAALSGELPTTANLEALTHLYWAFVDGIASAYLRGDPLPPPEEYVTPIDLFVLGAQAMGGDHFAGWPSARHA